VVSDLHGGILSADIYKLREALDRRGLTFATASAADIAKAAATTVGPVRAVKAAAAAAVSHVKAKVDPAAAAATRAVRLPICQTCPQYRQTGGGHMCSACLCVGANFDAKLGDARIPCPIGKF
jgi:hypothetical protein